MIPSKSVGISNGIRHYECESIESIAQALVGKIKKLEVENEEKIKILQETLAETFKQRDILATKLDKEEKAHTEDFNELQRIRKIGFKDHNENIKLREALDKRIEAFVPATEEKFKKIRSAIETIYDYFEAGFNMPKRDKLDEAMGILVQFSSKALLGEIPKLSEIPKTMFGFTIQELLQMRDFAIMHGYKLPKKVEPEICNSPLQACNNLKPCPIHDKVESKFDPQSMDAKIWAKEFMRLYENNKLRPINVSDWVDEALMIGWFANAIMAGYDEARRRNEKQGDLQTVLDAWHTVFGTTQLTHAEDRLRVAEEKVKKQEQELKEIRNLILDDVPHQYQKRLLEVLNGKR